MLSNDMASLSKHPLSPLRALFFCLVVFFGGIAVRAQEASVTPLPAAPKAGTQADFIAAADEVLNQMSEKKNPAERYADARSADALGLIPKGFDLDSFMVNVLTEQVEGLYDPKTREFYIADWSPLADQRMVMAQELTHALEDQHFQIEAWLKAARPNEDAEL